MQTHLRIDSKLIIQITIEEADLSFILYEAVRQSGCNPAHSPTEIKISEQPAVVVEYPVITVQIYDQIGCLRC